MAGSSIDLMSLFQAASSVLSQNKTELNQADPYNHDHGDNISQVFNLITQAVGQKSTASPTAQLNYASQVLQQQATSGSSQLYAQALQTAASQLQGQSNISANNIMPLIQSLLGGGQQPNPNTMANSGSGDLLGGLLSAFNGGGAQQSGTGTQQGGGGIQLDDILRGGMAFLQAQQSGGGGVQGVVDALIAGSPLGESPARAQSAQLIAHSILATAAPLLNQKTNKKPVQKPGLRAGQIGATKVGSSGSRTGGVGKREPSRGKGRSR
jgi:hypothetical protein